MHDPDDAQPETEPSQGEPCPICKGDGELMPGPILCLTCDGFGTVRRKT